MVPLILRAAVLPGGLNVWEQAIATRVGKIWAGSFAACPMPRADDLVSVRRDLAIQEPEFTSPADGLTAGGGD